MYTCKDIAEFLIKITYWTPGAFWCDTNYRMWMIANDMGGEY